MTVSIETDTEDSCLRRCRWMLLSPLPPEKKNTLTKNQHTRPLKSSTTNVYVWTVITFSFSVLILSTAYVYQERKLTREDYNDEKWGGGGWCLGVQRQDVEFLILWLCDLCIQWIFTMNLMTKLWYTFAVKRDVVKESALALHPSPFPTYWYSPPRTPPTVPASPSPVLSVLEGAASLLSLWAACIVDSNRLLVSTCHLALWLFEWHKLK